MYSRIKGVFNKPITGVPGREVMVLDRDLKNGKLVYILMVYLDLMEKRGNY